MLRFKLTSPSQGTLVVEDEDPIGVNDISQTTKRSGQYEGIVYEFLINVDFIKKGRAFIIKAFEEGGIDALVYVTIYDFNPNTRHWEHYATGKIDFNNYNVSDETVTVNIGPSGIEQRILNQMDVEVNHESSTSENGRVLPPYKAFNVRYHSKVITKESKLQPADNRRRDEDTGEIGPIEVREYRMPTDPIFFPGGSGAKTMDSEYLWYAPLDTTRQVFGDLTKIYPLGNDNIAVFFPHQLLLLGNNVGVNAMGEADAEK